MLFNDYTKEIENLISQGESETLEFKSAFNIEVLEAIVAFVNKIGGYLVKVNYSEQKISIKTIPIQNVTDNVTDRKLIVLNFIKNNNKITIKEIAEILGVSKRTILRDIDLLKIENKLAWLGTKKGGYWKTITENVG